MLRENCIAMLTYMHQIIHPMKLLTLTNINIALKNKIEVQNYHFWVAPNRTIVHHLLLPPLFGTPPNSTVGTAHNNVFARLSSSKGFLTP